MTETRRPRRRVIAALLLAVAGSSLASKNEPLPQTSSSRTRSMTVRLDSLDGFQVTNDMRRVAFVRADTGDALVVRDLDTGADRTVVRMPGRKLSAPKWSPDGSRISVMTRDAATIVTPGARTGPHP